MVKFPAVSGQLFDDLLLLVDLDGIDATVVALVSIFLDGLVKGFIDGFDPRVENSLKTKEDGKRPVFVERVEGWVRFQAGLSQRCAAG